MKVALIAAGLLGSVAEGRRLAHKHHRAHVSVHASDEQMEKNYCRPQGIKEADCKAQAEKDHKECEKHDEELTSGNRVTRHRAATNKDRVKKCAALSRAERTPDPPSKEAAKPLRRAAAICEQDVSEICIDWTCPAFCQMEYAATKEAIEKDPAKAEEAKQNIADCEAQCNRKGHCGAVNLMVGEVEGLEEMQKLQAAKATMKLDALLREHLVKCICQRRTKTENGDDWGAVCYKGGLGLKKGEYWCQWDRTPSWLSLKKEAVEDKGVTPKPNLEKEKCQIGASLEIDFIRPAADKAKLEGDALEALRAAVLESAKEYDGEAEFELRNVVVIWSKEGGKKPASVRISLTKPGKEIEYLKKMMEHFVAKSKAATDFAGVKIEQVMPPTAAMTADQSQPDSPDPQPDQKKGSGIWKILMIGGIVVVVGVAIGVAYKFFSG